MTKKWNRLSKDQRIKIIIKLKTKGLSWSQIAVKVGLNKKNKSTVYQFADKIPELNYFFPKKQQKTYSSPQPIHTSNNPSPQPNGSIPPPPPKHLIPPPPPPPKTSIITKTTKSDEVTEEEFLLKKIEWNTKKSKRLYGSFEKKEDKIPITSRKDLKDLQTELLTKLEPTILET